MQPPETTVFPTSWSDLPSDLIRKVCSHVDTHIDYLRFRAICSTWRQANPFPSTFRPIKLPLIDLYTSEKEYSPSPPPFEPKDGVEFESPTNLLQEPGGDLFLTQSIIYVIQPEASNSPENSWLVKLEVVGDKQIFRCLSLFSGRKIKKVGKKINLLDFRFVEVKKVFHMRYVQTRPANWYIDKYDPENFNFRKVFYFPEVDDDGYKVVVMDGFSCLYHIEKGDDKWTLFKKNIADIIVYRGTLHAVARSGATYRFSSFFERQQLVIKDWVYNDRSGRLWKHEDRVRMLFVEDLGTLALVEIRNGHDTYFDYSLIDYGYGDRDFCAVGMRALTLDEGQKEWVEKKLGDRVFFLGDDCSFSVLCSYIKNCNKCVVYHADGYVTQYKDKFNEVSSGEDEVMEEVIKVASDIMEVPSSEDEDVEENREIAHSRALQFEHVRVMEPADHCHYRLDEFANWAMLFWPPPFWLNGN